MTTQHTDRELMQQALEVLSFETPMGSYLELKTALRERLAQPEQEPVAKMAVSADGRSRFAVADSLRFFELPNETKLYTATQPRQWVDLSDKEIHDCDPNPHNRFDAERIEFARAVLVKCKEKNHG